MVGHDDAAAVDGMGSTEVAVMLAAIAIYAVIGIAFAGVCVIATSGAPALPRAFLAAMWLTLWLPLCVMACTDVTLETFPDDHPEGF